VAFLDCGDSLCYFLRGFPSLFEGFPLKFPPPYPSFVFFNARWPSQHLLLLRRRKANFPLLVPPFYDPSVSLFVLPHRSWRKNFFLDPFLPGSTHGRGKLLNPPTRFAFSAFFSPPRLLLISRPLPFRTGDGVFNPLLAFFGPATFTRLPGFPAVRSSPLSFSSSGFAFVL